MHFNIIDDTVDERRFDSEKTKCHEIPFLLSQYSWMIGIGLFILSGFVFPRFHPAEVFTSPKTPNFPNNLTIFTHASDIHLAESEPVKVVNARALIHTMKFYKSDFNLISGDMVDSYGEKNWPKIGRQVKEDWDLWRRIVEEETSDIPFEIIDLAGNHDMWEIDDALGVNNMFLDYSYSFNRNNTRTMKDFHVKTVHKRGLTFVLLNLYRFPSVHPPYIYWSHPSREILDEIEDEFIRLKNDLKISKFFVVCHYPVDHNWWIRSSRGKTFEEIMKDESITAFFSGHFHPNEAQIIHHSHGAVEHIGPGAYQFKAFGIVTIDQRKMVYHNIHLEGPPKYCLLTSPVPREQISDHQVFDEDDGELRLVFYPDNIFPESRKVIDCDGTKNLTAASKAVFKVSGSINGNMDFSKVLPNGALLFTMKYKVGEGAHNVTIEGNKCFIKREFFVGKQYQGHKEEVACYQRGLFFLHVCAIPIFLFLFWILCPAPQISNSFSLFAEKIEMQICGNNSRIPLFDQNQQTLLQEGDFALQTGSDNGVDQNYNENGNNNIPEILKKQEQEQEQQNIGNTFDAIIKYLFVILCGPALLRCRMNRLPSSLRYLLFAFILYPLVFPNHIFKPIFGLHGWSFLCFVLVGKSVFYDEWALHMTMFYLLVVMVPTVIFVSSYKLFFINHWIFKINFLIAFSLWLGVEVVNYRWVGESVKVINLILNPTLVVIPLIMYVCIFNTLFKKILFKKDFFKGFDIFSNSK